jgi:hypothetical protein
MIGPDTSTGTMFDRLLSVMPQMAQAVNEFASEDNRRVALRVLLREYGLPEEHPALERAAEPALSVVPPLADGPAEGIDQGAVPSTAAGGASASRRRARKSVARKSWPSAPDMDFHPEGKPSLREFASEKAPANLDEKNTVVVYYLEEILGITAIHVGHVVAAYTESGWPYPAKPDNSLQVTASKKNWLVTSDMNAIRVTHQGRNLIRFHLPRNGAEKSA